MDLNWENHQFDGSPNSTVFSLNTMCAPHNDWLNMLHNMTRLAQFVTSVSTYRVIGTPSR